MVIRSLRHHFKKQLFFKAGFSLLAVLIFLAGFTLEVNAKPKGDTIVSGTIGVDTTWNLAGSPYLVNGNLTINSGVTLSIDPDVIVKFYGDISLEVFGTLDVNGADGSPVIITEIRDDVGGDSNGDDTTTTPAPGGWRGIYVADNGNAYLDYTELRYGGGYFYIHPWWGNHYGNIRKDANGMLVINHSLITQSAGCGADFNSTTGVLSVSNTLFSFNQQYGACLHDAVNTISFTASSFTNNTPHSIYTTLFSSGFSIPADNIMDRPIFVAGGVLNINSTWSRQIYALETITINPGFTLSLPAGAILKSIGDVALEVNGTLDVNGEAGNPVVITEIRDDIGGDSNGDANATTPAPGGWRGIHVADNGSASLDYAEIHYGGGYFYMNGWGNHYGNLRKDGAGSLSISHSVIAESGGCGLSFINSTGTHNISTTLFNQNLNYGACLSNATDTITFAASTFTNNSPRSIYTTPHSSGFAIPADNLLDKPIYVGGGNLDVNSTWSPQVYIAGTIFINTGYTLTIPAGAIVKFEGDQALEVYGTLDLNGEDGNPVIITEARDDTGGDSNGDGTTTTPAPGGWRGVYVADFGNASLSYAELRYGGGNFYWNGWANHYGNLRKEANGTLAIDNSLITQSAGCGLDFSSSTGVHSVSNTVFSYNQQYGVCLHNALDTITFAASTFTNNTPYSIYTTPLSSGFSIPADNILERGIFVEGGTLSVNSAWSPQIYVMNTITVNSGITLTLPGSAILKFLGDQALEVNGTLDVNGAGGYPGSPVVITEIRDDTGGDSNGDGTGTSPAPGSWRGIHVAENASASLDYTEIRYGGGYFYIHPWWGNHYGNLRKDNGGTLTINHSTITKSAANGLGLIGTVEASQISHSLIFDNLGWGLYVETTACNLNIETSKFDHNSGGGISLINPSGFTNFFANTIVANTGTGIWLGNETAATVGGTDANGNNIYGNTGLELQNTSTISVDASNNWWGINPPDYAGIAGNVDASSPLSGPALNAPAYLADLTISGTGFPASVLIGEEMSLPLQIGSFGPRESYYVKVSASLPAGVSLTGFTGTGWTCSQVSQDVSCVLATLASWGVSSLEISLISPDPVHLDFDFILSQANNDMIPSNNIVSVDTQVNTRIFLPLVQK